MAGLRGWLSWRIPIVATLGFSFLGAWTPTEAHEGTPSATRQLTPRTSVVDSHSFSRLVRAAKSAAGSTPSGTPTSRRALPSPTPETIAGSVAVTATATVAAGGTRYSLLAAWPMVGHDSGQSYADPLGSIVPASLPLVHLRWQAAGLTPQVEADGSIYAIGADGRVQALNAATGEIRHQYQTAGVVGLAYHAPYVYFNRGSEIRIVTASSADWSHTATDTSTSQAPSFGAMILSGSRLYVGAGMPATGTTTQYYAFDSGTGVEAWQHPGSFTSVPCLAYGTLYISYGPFGSADTDVIDAENGYQFRAIRKLGATQWHAAGNNVYASVLSGGSNRLKASIHAYDRFGKAQWVAHDIVVGAVLPDMVFGLAPGAVDARSARDGHRLWKSTVPGLQSVAPGSLAISGELVVVQANSGQIRLLDRATGTLMATLKPPFAGTAASSLVVGGGIIFESVSQSLKGGKTGPARLLAFGP